MNVEQVISVLGVSIITGQANVDKMVTGGYVSDLLSNVMGQAASGHIWVTMQGHKNIVAVASLAGLAAVIIAGGMQPDEDTVAKAEEEGVVLAVTPWPSFEVVGRLYQLGIKGI